MNNFSCSLISSSKDLPMIVIIYCPFRIRTWFFDVLQHITFAVLIHLISHSISISWCFFLPFPSIFVLTILEIFQTWWTRWHSLFPESISCTTQCELCKSSSRCEDVFSFCGKSVPKESFCNCWSEYEWC